MQMNRNEILENIENIFKELFDDELLRLTEETTAKDLADWDSLMHIKIMTTIEMEFCIKFEMEDIFNVKKVGDIITLILNCSK